ncbi:MAG: PQQ-binding-like beta-propeller repeat protein [Polyangiaceae bacterium]|nr:PQQ-binding-like beta-propeller repeat protein [Polyangiaceae bacterium]MCW5791410.1 PQQ-binding-like beta-propeller repeat protein [Polyangiaceae bacterium]
MAKTASAGGSRGAPGGSEPPTTRESGVRSWGLLIALGAGAFGALGCEAARTGANPELPNWAHRPSWSIQVDYRRPLRVEDRRVGEPYERGQPEIDPVGGRVFVGSSDHGLYAVSAANGHTIWRFETLGPVQSEPLYDPTADVVYFGSNDGALYRVRARDGKLLWRFMTNAEVNKRPVLSGGVLYASNANDTLLALDPETGKAHWTQHRSPAQGMEVVGHSGPVVSRGMVYFAYSDGNVIAYDAKTGAERWQPVDLSAEAEQLIGDVPQYLDVDTTPLAVELTEGHAVIVGSYEGGVYALDADTGNQIWSNPAIAGVTDVTWWSEPSRPDPQGGPMIPAKRLVIASTGISGLWALNPDTGERVWQRELPADAVSRPVPLLGALLFSTSQTGLFLVSPLDGGVIDGIHTGAGFAMPPAGYGTRAFVLSNEGYLLALHIAAPR